MLLTHGEKKRKVAKTDGHQKDGVPFLYMSTDEVTSKKGLSIQVNEFVHGLGLNSNTDVLVQERRG